MGLVVFVAQQPNKNSFQTAVLSDGNQLDLIRFFCLVSYKNVYAFVFVFLVLQIEFEIGI